MADWAIQLATIFGGLLALNLGWTTVKYFLWSGLNESDDGM